MRWGWIVAITGMQQSAQPCCPLPRPSQDAPSNLARAASVPAEAQAAPGAPHDRRQLTGAWVAAGGRIRASEVLEGGAGEQQQ